MRAPKQPKPTKQRHDSSDADSARKPVVQMIKPRREDEYERKHDLTDADQHDKRHVAATAAPNRRLLRASHLPKMRANAYVDGNSRDKQNARGMQIHLRWGLTL